MTTYINIFEGRFGLGHRPKKKALVDFQREGVTHIWTLLSEKEGALEIKHASERNGIEWIWLPLENGKPPVDDLIPTIIQCFSDTEKLLHDYAKIYLHCSAGIHRTGMIAYAFFRFLSFSKDDSIVMLENLRTVTKDGVGLDRLAWGDTYFS